MTTLAVNGIDMLEQPELVLFDKDGTLIDIHHYWVGMVKLRADLISTHYFKGKSTKQETRHTLIDAMGVDTISNRMKRDGPVGVKPRHFIVEVVTETIRNQGIKVEESDIEALFSEVDWNTSIKLLPLLKVLPGVKELLSVLQGNNIPVAIVSTDITSRATAAMESLGLAHYFKTIIGGDAVLNTKPAPDLALAATTFCKVDPHRTAVIGDHPVDILMGQNAGCGLGVGVLNGISNPPAFEKLKCTTVPDLTHITVRKKC
uniref:HAD family hydrolase n=1 Tax=Rheinheimera sp. TaxID=1869214 RepID=UPI0040489134